MSYNGCSGNFSSLSYRSYLPSSCGSSYPSNLVYRTRTDSCSPSTCHLGSSLHGGCQETCVEPTNCERSCVVTTPCQPSCYYPRASLLGGSLGFGSSSCSSLDCGSRNCYSVGCGSRGFSSQNYGVRSFPAQYCRSHVCNPVFFPLGGFYSSCHQPFYTSGFY